MSRSDMERMGEIGERWVVQELRRRGYIAEWIGGNSDYDVLLEGFIRVEVKSALLSRRGKNGNSYRWQFNLRRHGLDLDEDLLFLLCYGDDLSNPPQAVFIIPGRSLPKRLTKIDITSRDPRAYRGQWRRWLDAWDEVKHIRATTPVRKPVLFRSTEAIPF